MIEGKDDTNTAVQSQQPRPRLIGLRRLLACWRRPWSVNIETILAAAERGQLEEFLTTHYTIYYDRAWRAHLRLCKDLVEDGYLKADFQEHFDGGPIFLKPDPRITIAGREYLEQIRQRKTWRRLLFWMSGFLTGLLSSALVKLLNVLIDVYAKRHGL
ncbi:MAG: hypothetical protein GXX96_10990 [Planctomycetaceae bacterium]|nr:hypothetical protein [Planctomycetaceae bacterium]